MRKNSVVLEDKNEFAKTIKQLTKSKTTFARRKAIPALAERTTILDIFQKLCAGKTQQSFERLVATHPAFFELAQDKSNQSRLSLLRSNPVLACLADESGEVVVGGDAYSVFEEDGVQSLNRMMPDPEPEPEPSPGGGSGGGVSTKYVFTELPPEWLVQSLPCGPWTVLPGYPTKFFDTPIGGRNVLVQLWKGSCPDYLGHSAGGVGAEVGLYNRDAWLPDTFWWPDYDHKKAIGFMLFNPKTNAELFSASSSVPIWWSHKWMKFPSYDQYVRDQNRNVPPSTADYVLRYKIDGRSFSW